MLASKSKLSWFVDSRIMCWVFFFLAKSLHVLGMENSRFGVGVV